MKKIKAIIFDVDGVVFNSLDEDGRYFWSKNVKADLGIRGEHFKLIFSPDWDNVTRGKISTEDHLLNVFADDIFKNLISNGLTPESYIAYWLSHDNHINLAVMDFVKTLDIAVYLGTNQDEYRTKHIIKHVGNLFKDCFASYQIGHIKPEREFFTHIQNALNLEPSDLLLIDDTKANVDGAKASGWQAFLYQNNLDELKSFIAQQTQKPWAIRQ